jgi:hypothetical protein
MLEGESSPTESSTSVEGSTDDEQSDDEYQPKNQGKRPAASLPPSRGRETSRRKRKATVTVEKSKGKASVKRTTPVSLSSLSPELNPCRNPFPGFEDRDCGIRLG